MAEERIIEREEAKGEGVPAARRSGPSLGAAAVSHLLILGMALFFTLLYANTFRGHRIHSWTHGPFNFEGGIYRSYAVKKIDPATTGNDKLIKHLLCAVLYPPIHGALFRHFPVEDSPLVCSFLGGLSIALFGVWIYWRTRGSPVVFPVILLMGFSFTTWYVGSVWESRAFILFGSVVLLIAIDRFLVRPGLVRFVFAVLASIFSILITIGNVYLLPLVPAALLFRARKIGWKKAAAGSIIAVLLIVLLVAAVYQLGGTFLNPRLKLGEFFTLIGHEKKLIEASFRHFDGATLKDVAVQGLVYSVGGIRMPASGGALWADAPWGRRKGCLFYFQHLPGVLFLNGYGLLIIAVIVGFFRKKLWLKEPILWVIIFWFLLYIAFFVYFNPQAGPVYAAELQPPLWALVALALSRRKSGWTVFLLGLFLLVLAWNNREVIRFFKEFYGGKGKTLITSSIQRTKGNYNLWVWGVKPERKTGDRVRVEMAHAVAGKEGGFWIVAYADTTGDGQPDEEIARSDFLIAERPGDWSGFDFETEEEVIFVGNTWEEGKDAWIYRSPRKWPGEAPLLEDRFYWKIKPGSTRSAGPAQTNLKVSFPE